MLLMSDKIEGMGRKDSEGATSRNPAEARILRYIERFTRIACVVFCRGSYHARDYYLAKLSASVKELTPLLLTYKATPPIEHSVTRESLFYSVAIHSLNFY